MTPSLVLALALQLRKRIFISVKPNADVCRVKEALEARSLPSLPILPSLPGYTDYPERHPDYAWRQPQALSCSQRAICASCAGCAGCQLLPRAVAVAQGGAA